MHPAPRRLLRLEGAAVLALSVLLYAGLGTSWWWFAGFFFAPDLAMLAYAAGPRAGAAAYNAVHAYVLPLALAGAGVALASAPLLAAGLIGTAHIGFDRMLGYGLKLPDDFRHTHLGPIGRPSARDGGTVKGEG